MFGILNPKDLNIKVNNFEHIVGKDPDYNAKAFLELIEAPNNSLQKIVEINSGAAIYLSGKVKNLKEGIELAKKTIENKKSKNYFQNLITNQ